MFGAGCTTTKNYAPVRNFNKELLENKKNHVVKQGDTLYSIGFRSGNDYKKLAVWNKIYPPYKLEVGQEIKLFEPKQRLIKHVSSPKKVGKVKVKNKATKKTLTISNDKEKMLKFYWQWPLNGRILKRFSQTANKGIDIAGSIGKKVKSAAPGKVVYSGSGLTGYGNLLIIKHNNVYLSAYANNSRLLVNESQVVKQGQVIAEVGRIGGKQASLHFEIRKNGKPVDPLKFLPKK
jgi:lipoprotein NlpD